MVGGGASSTGGFAADMTLNTSRPFDGADANLAEDDGWSAWFDNRGFSDQEITAYAICRKGVGPVSAPDSLPTNVTERRGR